ncbi:50S ribosomal protein L11 methyltransferase [Sphingomonas lenta]|uniref:50S ribosomal protein L11 methyltransferase n=1 Tax=Sphingomonas lenta TaxID=1141887 RepID=UPI001FE95225|nr:50S ribosomal protein L11 methyltransferase [Sphingomonas lenta]
MGTTSSSGGAPNKDSWKVTLPCTKAEAEAIGDAEMEGVVLLVTEEDEATGRWRLDAYVEGEPDAAALAAIRALTSSVAVEPRVEGLGDEDWVTLSQAGLEPIREGRFVVHTSAFPVEPPPGGRAFLIEAGQAFGTGHHETTAGCLHVLDALAERRFANAVDLGTGTGLLAFAARELWPDAQIMATDIDPVAIEVTRENMEVNGVERIDLVVADGARDPAIQERAPFDLVIANILAGPLIAMAPEVAAIAAPGAAVVLAGLLETQADAVVNAYRAAGCALERSERRGDWTILLLRAGETVSSVAPANSDRNAWATDT